jgi:hypothetical protein
MIETASLVPIYTHIPFIEVANCPGFMLQWSAEGLCHKSHMSSKESSTEPISAERDCHPQ